MTNAEKYKTAEERKRAFCYFCLTKNKGICFDCPAQTVGSCTFVWLELEAEEAK